MVFKHVFSAIAIVGAAAVPLGAAGQSEKVKTETKLEVKDGKDVTLTGCLERSPASSGETTQYRLTNVADKKNELHSYLLVGGDNGDLQSHVGHMVEIKGKAADHEDGKVKVKTKTTVDREDADDVNTESKSELKGDLIGLPLLGVRDVKMIRPTCP
jgi:hypothetical protein